MFRKRLKSDLISIEFNRLIKSISLNYHDLATITEINKPITFELAQRTLQILIQVP